MHPDAGLPRRLAVAAACALASLAGPARAQVIDSFPASLPGYENDYLLLPLQSENGREAAGHGIRLGDFVITPVLTELGGYDTNPYGVSGSGSALEETRVLLGARSDWSRDALDGQFTLDNINYPSQSLYGQTDWTASAGGSLDLGRGRLEIGYSHLALNLDPQQLGTQGVTAPIPYTDDDVRTDADIVLGRVRLVPALDWQTLQFASEPSVSAEQAASFGALDRTSLAETLTGLFELSEGRSLVAIVRDKQADYRQLTGVPDANYNDLLAAVGFDYQADAPIRLRAVAGGERRVTQADGTISTPFIEASVLWEPTRLTDITLTFRRRLDDAATVTAGTEILTEGRAEIDHALRRNVLLSVFADIGVSDYQQGAAAGSSQRVDQIGVSVGWGLSRHAVLSLSYNYGKDDEGEGFPGGTSNVVTIGLKLQD